MLASIPLKDIQIQDRFWKERLDLVRKEIIPYQWEAMNDRVPNAFWGNREKGEMTVWIRES